MNDDILDLSSKFLDLEEKRDDCENEIKRLKSKVDDLNSQMQSIGRQMMELFSSGDVNSIKVRGRTLYIHKQSWAKPKDKDLERACRILKEIGMQWLVEEKINTHTISAHVRECDAQDIPLPARFSEAFEVSDVFSIRSRKS